MEIQHNLKSNWREEMINIKQHAIIPVEGQ